MIPFKFLRTTVKPEPEYRFVTFTNIYNRVDIVQLPWSQYPNYEIEPKEFKGTFTQFRQFYLHNNFLPVIYEMQLSRSGWVRRLFSYYRRLDTKILKNDKLVIFYD